MEIKTIFPIIKWKDRHDLFKERKEQILETFYEIIPSEVYLKLLLGTIPLQKIIPGEYLAEIKKMSKILGIPIETLVVGNVIYDLSTALGLMSYKCGCSLIADSYEGLYRNLDWCIPFNMADQTVIWDRGHYYDVGFPGFMGTVTAFNERRAVALNQAFPEPGSCVTAVGRTLSFLKDRVLYRYYSPVMSLRRVMDHDLDLIDSDGEYNYFTPAILTEVEFGETVRRADLYHNGEVAIYEEPLIVTTNHYMDEDDCRPEYPELEDGYEMIDSWSRKETIEEHLVDQMMCPEVLRDAINSVRDGEETAYTIIVNDEGAEIY